MASNSKSFINEWKEAVKKGSGFHFPPDFPMNILITDVATRQSNCRECKTRIPAGEERVVCLSKYALPRPASNGGVMMGKKFFYHPECVVSFLNPTKQSIRRSQSRCSRCGRFQKFTNIYQVNTSASFQTTPMCIDCINHENLQRCQICTSYVVHHRISPALDQTGSTPTLNFFSSARKAKILKENLTGGPDLVCDNCSANWGVVRVKDQTKQTREDDRLEKKLFEIRELMIRDELWK